MPSPTNANIDKFIEAREQSSPARFCKLLRSVDGVPSGTTGWYYNDIYPSDETRTKHLFKPYEPLSPKKWIDKYGVQRIAIVRKEDVG